MIDPAVVGGVLETGGGQIGDLWVPLCRAATGGSDSVWASDTTKRLMSFPKCRSVEVINNPTRPGSNHREVNCINYKQQ